MNILVSVQIKFSWKLIRAGVQVQTSKCHLAWNQTGSKECVKTITESNMIKQTSDFLLKLCFFPSISDTYSLELVPNGDCQSCVLQSNSQPSHQTTVEHLLGQLWLMLCLHQQKTSGQWLLRLRQFNAPELNPAFFTPAVFSYHSSPHQNSSWVGCQGFHHHL